jgi:hypothetical protein
VMIAVVGVGTMALRGGAEDVAPTATANTSAAKLFARTPLDPSVLNHAKDGMFVIRPSELAKHPALRAWLPTLNSMLSDDDIHDELRLAYRKGRKPFRLEAIEYIAGTPTLQQRPKTAEQRGSFIVGCSELIVRFHEPVDWLKWFEEMMPSCKPTTDGGLTYVSAPIPLLGPSPLLVAARDERTIVLALSIDHLRKLAASDRVAREWELETAWNSMDGGAATFVSKAAFADSLPPEGPGGKEFISIVNNVERVAVGFDVDGTSGESQIKVTLGARNLTAGGRVQAAVQALLPLAKAMLQAQLAMPVIHQEDPNGSTKRVLKAGTEDSNEQVLRYYLGLVENCQVELKPQESGAVEVTLSATAAFPQSVFAHYEHVAVKEEAAIK